MTMGQVIRNTNKKENQNPKNTLFRFVTMRAPQLIEGDEVKNSFVKINEDEYSESHFLSGILNDESSNKKILLESLVSTFSRGSIKSKKELTESKFVKFAAWLTANRSKLTKESLDENWNDDLNGHDSYLDKWKLWDNLFYQILTSKSSEIREVLLSLLAADFFLTERKNLKETDTEALRKLAQARIIIPNLLLNDNEDRETAGNEVYRSVPINSRVLDKQLELHLASKAIEDLQSISLELERGKTDYDQQNNLSYQQAFSKYEKNVAEIYKNATTKEQKYFDKETGIERKYVEYVGIEIPSFEFKPEPELNYIANSSNISESAYEVLKTLMSNNTVSVSQALAVLNQEITQQSQILISELPSGQTIVNNGGILTPVSNDLNTSSLGKIFSLAAQSVTGKSPLTLLLSNAPAGADVIQASYSATFDNNTVFNGSSFQDSWVNGKLQVKLFLENLDYSNTRFFNISGEFILSNNTTINFSGKGIVSDMKTALIIRRTVVTGKGAFSQEAFIDENNPTNPVKDPVLQTATSFGFRRLGIADYRKVEQEICCYVPGEVSHIENIMAREFKEKTTRRSRKTEDTFISGSETETEKLTDTSTTERFEMNQEAASVIAKDMHIGVQAGVHWGSQNAFGGSVNADFATNTSSEDSNSQAVTHAKDVTERALDRVVQKIKEERTSKIIEEFSEEDTHGFDNRKGDTHVSGVYRWVDKVYKNKVINYGKRLMYEFMIPEPSAFHNKVTSGRKDGFTSVLTKPIDPRTVTGTLGLKNVNVLNLDTYKHWAAIFNADIEAYPLEEIVAGESFNIIGNAMQLKKTESSAGNGKVKIPEGYKAYYASGIYNASGDDDASGNILSLSIGNLSGKYTNSLWNYTLNVAGPIQGFENEVPVSYTLGNHVAGDISVTVKCKLTEKAKEQWRLAAFNLIITAYENKLKEFEAKLNEAKAIGDQKAKTNPGFYRQVENMILRKNCIAYMLGDNKMGKNMLSGNTVEDLAIKQDAALDAYAGDVKFLEQAFEWNLMSYNFYPFYWANKDKWAGLYNPDEMNDPIFRAFLQSGMARVILTVTPGFEEAVNWFMATKQVWNGGQVPTIDDPLFVSIVKELSETTGEIEETWETRVPTSLTIIQAGTMGLNVVNALPCDDDCEDNLLFDSDGEPIRDAEGNAVKVFEKTDALIGGKNEEETSDQQKMAKEVQKMQGRMIENVDIQDGYIKLTTDDNPRKVVAQISVEHLKREMGL